MEKKETKVCTRCGKEMPLESFPKNNRSKDGHLSVCKECNFIARSAARPRRLTAEEVKARLEEHISSPSTGPAAHPEIMSAIADKTLVEELRSRGWEVTCKRTIVEEL